MGRQWLWLVRVKTARVLYAELADLPAVALFDYPSRTDGNLDNACAPAQPGFPLDEASLRKDA